MATTLSRPISRPAAVLGAIGALAVLASSASLRALSTLPNAAPQGGQPAVRSSLFAGFPGISPLSPTYAAGRTPS